MLVLSCKMTFMIWPKQKQDESLLEDVWTLLRAGRLEEACDLCRSAGQVSFESGKVDTVVYILSCCIDNAKMWQPWRAATLCPFGGLDQFPSIEALLKNGKTRALQAIELESGIPHRWHLWKWASYCASEVELKTWSNIFIVSVKCVSNMFNSELYHLYISGLCYQLHAFFQKLFRTVCFIFILVVLVHII